MKHLAVALIVIALIAGDFGSDIWMNDTRDNRNWSLASTTSLILAIGWFFHHRD